MNKYDYYFIVYMEKEIVFCTFVAIENGHQE